MSDQHSIQGLWRIVTRTYRGEPLPHSASHYVFSGSSRKEIVPSLVDDGSLRSTFVLDEEADPKQMTIVLDYNGPDGPPDPDPIVLRALYELDGDRLRLCFGPGGEFPPAFSDEYQIVTLERDRGPMPETRQPSGTPPLQDDVLGPLPWDDNLNWYSGRVDMGGRTIDVSLTSDDRGDFSASLARAREIVTRFEHYRELAADYAVAGLLELKNDCWLDEDQPEVTPDEFKSRLSLEAITVDPDGSVTFWHRDGDLFLGHSIEVRIGAHDQCTDAGISG